MASPDEVVVRPGRRWIIIGSFFLVLFLLLISRLFFLQILDQKASEKVVLENSLRKTNTPATRGIILDREGHALVTNITTTEIRLSRAEVALHPNVEGSLSSLTGLSVKQIAGDVANVQYDPYQPVPILANAPAREVEYIKLHPGEFPGVTVLHASQRSYPNGGNTAAQVLGYVGPITKQEIEQNPHEGYQRDSTIGKSGIESFYESYLKGVDGTSTIEVNSQNAILGVIRSTPPVVGDSVVLNIDTPLQKALDADLANDIIKVRHSIDPVSKKVPPALNGAAIVLDPNNGQVLAMSSYPSFNLDSFTNGVSDAEFKVLNHEGAFNNFAIQGAYTPGSTFKLVTATAELQTGVLPAYKYINDTGTFTVPGCFKAAKHSLCVFHDDDNSAAGLIDLPEALTVSSDYYFYNLGYLFWSQTGRYGQTPIQNVAAEYGLSEKTNIDLPDEVQGRVDSPEVRKELHAEAPVDFPHATWYTGDNIEMAFGQGTTAVSPIEMADAYATFANGGTLYQPEVAAAVINPHGDVVVRYAPHILGHVNLPQSVRDPILEGLTGVVSNPKGTAYDPFHSVINFSLANFPIAGKTGTASNAPGLEPNSWFVGFGPTTHPEYVVLCVIDEGGYGADAAAPVVAEAFNYLVAHPVPAVKLKAALTAPTHATTTTKTTSTTTTTTK